MDIGRYKENLHRGKCIRFIMQIDNLTTRKKHANSSVENPNLNAWDWEELILKVDFKNGPELSEFHSIVIELSYISTRSQLEILGKTF